MKRFLKIIFIWSFLLAIIGCGDGGKEAKELLARLLQVVGIPYEMVVNICQDSNGNGFCDKMEIHTKITINKYDTADKILAKIKLDENGTYLLEHYDPTKKILMEVEDINKTKKRVTLTYTPKDPKKVKVQELSILQALIDAGLIQAEEIESLKKSKKARELVDDILLENLFYNQVVLEEQNVPTTRATELNLEYIAEGLKDINVSGDFVERVENNESNTSAIELIKEDIDQQTEINITEAKVIAETNSTEGTGDRNTVLTQEENNSTATDDNNTTSSQESNTTEDEDNNSSNDNNTTTSDDSNNDSEEDTTTEEKTEKNVADGYIIKLESPASAECIDGSKYNSSLSVGSKGLITFEGISLGSDCNITIPSGATIDSNNNGLIDDSDVVMNFEMKGPADASFISPLTTLLLEKMANGEDVTKLKEMVKDFDPVSSTNSDSDKKLLLLLETTKELLKSNQNLSSLSINDFLNKNKSLSDINISNSMNNFSSSVNSVISEKVNTKKALLELFDDIDHSKIDISKLFVSISDGGANLKEAIEISKKTSINSEQIFESILNSSSDIENLIPKLEDINLQLSQNKTALQKAISILENLQPNDDIEAKLEKSKLILKLANPREKDAKVGLALFDLAEITNSPEVSSLLDISLKNGENLSENLLTIIKGSLLKEITGGNEIETTFNVSDGRDLTATIVDNLVNQLENIEKTLDNAFSDSNYIFKYNDINLTHEQSKLLRAEILLEMGELEYIVALKSVKVDDIKVKTFDYNGDIVEYTEIDSNPIPILNREDFGVLDSTDRLTKAKNLLLKAVDVYKSFDVNSIKDEEERDKYKEDQERAIKIKNSILGKELYTDINDLYPNISEKIDYDFSALFNPNTAIELSSILGHNFVYGSLDKYKIINNKVYFPGDYNLTLSKYFNKPLSNYWVAEDGSKVESNNTIKLEAIPTKIPTGTDSTIPNTIKKIEIIENNDTILYSFDSDDELRYIFNEFNLFSTGSNYMHFSNSSDINITYQIKSKILIPYDTNLTYHIKVDGRLADWLHSKVIDDKTIQITADSNITNKSSCYIIKFDVIGHYDSSEYCIDVY